MQYMYYAGYDPNAFVNVFEHLQALEKKKPGALAKAFSTHPQTADRIQKSQEEIATVLPPREQYVENTSEFNEIKARLAALEGHRRLDDANPNKPTLRRTPTDKPGDSDAKDHDRPPLHRRDP